MERPSSTWLGFLGRQDYGFALFRGVFGVLPRRERAGPAETVNPRLTRRLEKGFDFRCCGVLHVGQDVRVHVQCKGNARVPELLADYLRRNAGDQ